MKVTLTLDPDVLLFYTRIALSSGKPVDQVLTDALLHLAEQLSIQALRAREDFSEKSL
jgi:hypothetical protein